MSEAQVAPEGEASAVEPESKHEDTVPFERFQKVNQQAKEAKQQAAALSQQMEDLKTQMEERETAGLPELERERKRAEQLEKRAAQAESRAAEVESRLAKTTKERWVIAAASSLSFADPSDAAAFVDLEGIDDEKDAERAVKRLAASKKHLLKSDEPQIPGRVLQNGQPSSLQNPAVQVATEEAQMLSNALQKLRKQRQSN